MSVCGEAFLHGAADGGERDGERQVQITDDRTAYHLGVLVISLQSKPYVRHDFTTFEYYENFKEKNLTNAVNQSRSQLNLIQAHGQDFRLWFCLERRGSWFFYNETFPLRLIH